MLNVNKLIIPSCILVGILLGNVAGVTYNFVHINFFTQDVVENGAGAVFKYFPFKSADEKAVIAGVLLHYIKNNEPLATVVMTKTGDYYSAALAAATASPIDYYYTLVCAPLTGTGKFSDDTKWFTKIMGQQFDPSQKFPLTVLSSGRFRDRHENEYRSDIFPGADFSNTVYMLSFKDYGDSIEFGVFPGISSTKLELHAFNHIVADSVCAHAEFALNMGSATNFLVKQHTGPDPKFPSGSPFGPAVQWYSATVAAVSLGELVDFELLLTDSSGTRTYTSVVYRYYVGTGKLGQRFQHPWANAAGDASVSSITEPRYSFTQHCVNAAWGRTQDFLAGKSLFDTDWNSGFLRTPPAGPDCNGSTVPFPIDKSPFFAAGALGPGYLQASCYQCHVQAGAGHTADSTGDSLQAMVFLGVPQQNAVAPHPVYGDVLRCKTTGSGPPDGRIQVSYTLISGTFNDGASYTIRKPEIAFVNLSKGPLDSTAVSSCRISPFLCGEGLLEAVPEDSILLHADSSDRDNDGISGRANFAVDPVDGVRRLGRFGWKASLPSLKGEIAFVANRCLGLTSRYFPVDGGGTGAELSDSGLGLLLSYAALCAPPPRNNWQDSSALRGKALFEGAGCVKCHLPAMRTGSTSQFTELNNLEIQPFTDLLLHDMGAGLADNYSQENALGSEWRTAPLWGIGFIADAGGRESYLHDGRAQSIMEAVLWHGGEAEKAKNAVLGFTAQQRNDLVAYCKYPFADRLPRPLASPVAAPYSRQNSQRYFLVCWPNTVRTVARFMLSDAGDVAHAANHAPALFSVYNMRGQCVFRQAITAGAREVVWNSMPYKAGKYLAQLCREGRTYASKVVVIR